LKFGRSRGWTIAAALLIGQALADAISFSNGITVAKLPAFLDEVSGLAQSRTNPGVFWVHNDSGDEPRIYAVGRSGTWLGTYTLAGAAAIDWEDMAIGPAADGRSYLYLADIGDNNGRRPSVRVYRVNEPVVRANQSPVTGTLSSVTSFDFIYDNGPRDAEGFMVDALTNDFYVVSKREPEGNYLYRAASPSTSRMNTLERVGKFSTTGTTGADISRDGLEVLIRRYSSTIDASAPPALAGSYWRRPDASVSLVTLLQQPGQTVPLVAEMQGEAIAFAADGRGFYTTSEHGSMPGATSNEAVLTFYAIIAK
jgi:hypothetical protein